MGQVISLSANCIVLIQCHSATREGPIMKDGKRTSNNKTRKTIAASAVDRKSGEKQPLLVSQKQIVFKGSSHKR
jgi:hypothetical protein